MTSALALRAVILPRNTLAADLSAAGVPKTVSIPRVRAYQKAEVRRRRQEAGLWGTIWPVARVLNRTGKWAFCLAVLSGLALAGALIAHHAIRFSAPADIAARLAWIGQDLAPALVGALALSGVYVGLVLSLACGRREYSFSRAISHWERVPLQKFRKRVAEGHIPDSVERTIAAAEGVPGARIEVEYLEDDPFVFAVRGRGLFRERECVDYFSAPGFREAD